MHMKLERGEFLGDTLGSKQIPGIHMQLRQYSAGHTLPVHSHQSAYLCLVRAGIYDEHFGSRTRVCQPGTLAFHPAGEDHYQRVGAEPVVLMNVEMDARWTDRTLFKEPWSVTHGPLVSLANKLYDEFQLPDDLTPLAVEALLLEMAVLKERSEKKLPPRWLSRATYIMHESLTSPLRMRQVAKEMGVHPAHFSRAFRRYFGCSPIEYLRRLRVEEARRLLLTTSKPGAAIAMQCGFSDQSHLNRSFLRQLGVTPAVYRRLVR
jgi:AraC family transcriptional regulator